MATYKDGKYLTQLNHAAFDTITPVGHTAPYSGIYRCEGCGHEIVSTYGHVLPPQNHPQHSPLQGQIRWRLIVSHQPQNLARGSQFGDHSPSMHKAAKTRRP